MACVRCVFGKTSLASSYHTQVRFCFYRYDFFDYASNISGTAERICAKFTWKTCSIPRSDEFEGQCQRSRSQGTKWHFSVLLAACMRFMFGETPLASIVIVFVIVVAYWSG